MEYLEIRRFLLTIFLIVQACDITWTQMCRQNNANQVIRCSIICLFMPPVVDTWYCIYLGDVNWADAQAACTEKQDRLAWDTSAASNYVLYELIRIAEVSQAWIGGKTGPLYFNWMNKDFDPAGVYYQGCYKSGNELISQCEFKWSINDCKYHCHRFKYFSHHKERSSRICCCGDKFGMMDGGLQGSCSVCDGDMPCGEDSTHRAIYMTNAQFPAKHIWKTFHPVGLTDYQTDAICMAVVYNDTTSSVWIEDKRCTDYHYPLCILDKTWTLWGGWRCAANEFKMGSLRKCLAYIGKRHTWETAVDQCMSLSPNRNSVLSSFASYTRFVELEGVIRNIVVASRRHMFWTFGSSRRWVWEDKDTYMRQDIEYARWDNEHGKFIQKDHCTLLNENAKWESTSCAVKSAAYICESDEKPTIPTTIVLTTSLKTETTTRSIATTADEEQTNSVPHRSGHITSFRPMESSTFSFTTEYSGAESEPQSAYHTLPVVAGVGSVAGLSILTVAVVLLVCWQRRRRMADKGSGTGNVNDGFSSRTGVDLHNLSDNVYNELDHEDYTTIAGTENRADTTVNFDCAGEHVYESAQCSDLQNVVKDHIQNISPQEIIINEPERGIQGSTKYTDLRPTLNPVTETQGDVSVVYAVPKKDRKNQSEKNQQDSNPVLTKSVGKHKEKKSQRNPGQPGDQSTECEGAVVYAVPKKPSESSEIAEDGNTTDSVYAFANEWFHEENVNGNTDNADYYNLIVSQSQQRNKETSTSDDLEDATTLVDNDIYNT